MQSPTRRFHTALQGCARLAKHRITFSYCVSLGPTTRREPGVRGALVCCSMQNMATTSRSQIGRLAIGPHLGWCIGLIGAHSVLCDMLIWHHAADMVVDGCFDGKRNSPLDRTATCFPARQLGMVVWDQTGPDGCVRGRGRVSGWRVGESVIVVIVGWWDCCAKANSPPSR